MEGPSRTSQQPLQVPGSEAAPAAKREMEAALAWTSPPQLMKAGGASCASSVPASSLQRRPSCKEM